MQKAVNCAILNVSQIVIASPVFRITFCYRKMNTHTDLFKGTSPLKIPKKANKMKNKIISCRVSESEYNYIKNHNIKIYDMIFYFLNDTTKEMKKEKNKLLYNIANNLNQLAKHCNITKQAPTLKEIKEIKELIKNVL